MQAHNWPSVAVVGAGAVGCYFGGMLARAAVPVTLIGRAYHIDAIARNALLLDGLHFHERIPVAASTSIESVRGKQVVLICVKSVDTESAARDLVPFLSPGAILLSLQNGVDNVDRIFAAAGLLSVPVAVYVAAAMAGPGHVKHTGRGDLVIGSWKGWPRAVDLQPLAALFEHAEIPCRVSELIEVELWAKLVMNCAYNAISALTHAKYGKIVRFEPVCDILRRAVVETVAVARAQGVDLPESEMVASALRLGEAMSGATSSTAQDLARGKITEIDSLNGYVTRCGAAAGVPTPVNDTLTALVKLLEQSG